MLLEQIHNNTIISPFSGTEYSQDEGKRVKDIYGIDTKSYNSLTDNMKDIISTYDRYNGANGLKITSTTGGKHSEGSHHHGGNAFDMRVNDDSSKMAYWLMNTKEGLETLVRNKSGIIDESDPFIMKMISGKNNINVSPNFHIGKDSYYANVAKKRLQVIENGGKLNEWTPYHERQDNSVDYYNSNADYYDNVLRYIGEGNIVSGGDTDEALNGGGIEIESNEELSGVGKGILENEVQKAAVHNEKSGGADRQKIEKKQAEVEQRNRDITQFLSDISSLNKEARDISVETPQQEQGRFENVRTNLQDYNPNLFQYGLENE